MTDTTAAPEFDDTHSIVLDAYRAARVDGLDFYRHQDGVNFVLTLNDEALVIGWEVWEGQGGYSWTAYTDLDLDQVLTTDGGDESAARAAVAEWIATR